eukprot:CAMPEP_0197456716 /NCGR_PEP_ID=MMETSP1175-20131217/44076_1 /TAXON_ID=1003142 /ORGANISM="Triceratium dubium, Strain CCMP147" /LENGTH=379 /DNA_ID=CAMNT_0042990857 /DNA_START=31 /DNA_END=1167 /DNA_ORIENTATION=-
MGESLTTSKVDGLSALTVGDSTFIGFATRIHSKSEAISFQEQLKCKYPDAAHVPLCWLLPSPKDKGSSTSTKLSIGDDSSGFDEDGEPTNSAGPLMLEETHKSLQVTASASLASGVALGIVRFFGEKLLGVTCGRLPQCYKRASRLTLHRFFFPGVPLVDTFVNPAMTGSIYGLAAGDTELILDVVADNKGDLLDTVRSELEFGGFRGAKNEVLPRLQNLQADVGTTFIPVYRYPGNYQGDEWETYQWSPISLEIKKAVEDNLAPLVQQTMNHCVTNLYRCGDDFIAHHSDKDLDLNREGVIVSVSLGDERILELRRRAEPQDIVRVSLPHCSMLVLGPNTNRLFTHSIMKKEGNCGERISLTLREVKTFLDPKTGRMW